LYYYHKNNIGLISKFYKIHCKSLVDKYINWNEKLNVLCLVEFVVNYDTKINKRCSKSKIIHWLSFNQHKNLKNHYRKMETISKIGTQFAK
jgi:hypothetical protein